MALERRSSDEDDGPVDTFADTIRFVEWATAELELPESSEPDGNP